MSLSERGPLRALVERAGKAVVMIAGAGILLLACAESADRPVAAWDGGRIEQADYQAWLEHQSLEDSPASIRELALIQSMAAAARQRGLEDDPGVGLTVEAMRHDQLLAALKRHIDAQVSITDEEIEQLRVTYPDAFQQPRKLFLRGIFKRLPTDEQARAQVFQRMKALREQVVEGGDIKPLALLESESQSRFREGSVGFVDPKELPPPVRDGVDGLVPGGVSPLIEHAGGLAFYVCERVRPAKIPDADEVRHKFRQNLFRQRSAELNKALLEQLGLQVQIQLDQDPALKVNDYALPADWLDELIRKRFPDRDAASFSLGQKRQLLRDWGLRVAMAEHAESLGLGEPDDLVATTRWSRLHALATAELRHQVDAMLRLPTENELQEIYEQRKARLRNPAGLQVAVIKFADAEGSGLRETVEQARDVAARIRAGQLAFGEAAREFSIHPSSANGGRLGWLSRQQLGALDMGMLQPVRALSPGEDTGLLRLSEGLWMLKLLEQRPATPKTFEQARESLMEMWRQAEIDRLQVLVREQHLAALNLQIPDD